MLASVGYSEKKIICVELTRKESEVSTRYQLFKTKRKKKIPSHFETPTHLRSY